MLEALIYEEIVLNALEEICGYRPEITDLLFTDVLNEPNMVARFEESIKEMCEEDLEACPDYLDRLDNLMKDSTVEDFISGLVEIILSGNTYKSDGVE